jgi:hypothetical protein
MATNLDVDIAAIEALMLLGKYKSKREAVDAAVAEAILYRRQLKTVGFLGTIDFVSHVASTLSAEGEASTDVR